MASKKEKKEIEKLLDVLEKVTKQNRRVNALLDLNDVKIKESKINKGAFLGFVFCLGAILLIVGLGLQYAWNLYVTIGVMLLLASLIMGIVFSEVEK